MSLVPNKALEGASGNQGYKLERSLRFRSSASAYLDCTLTTPTNNKIYTWSGWVKKGIIGTANRKVLFSARNGTNEDYFCYDDTNDNLRFFINSTNASTTSAVYRDASAWYHVMLVVDTTQATAANRVSIYVNGILAANANGTAPTQNSNTVMNGAYSHRQGAASYNGPWYFDGYLAEVNFIDGQALTPSSFGQTDDITGVWVPKKYTGTYGTNGFYLDFKDNSTTTALVADKSGNGNNLTPNNISLTAGATYDSMTDVPTLTSATAANFATLNPLANGANQVLANGNLKCSNANASWRFTQSTMAMSSGKWYYEAYVSNAWSYGMIGIVSASRNPYVDTSYFTSYTNSYGYQTDGRYYNNTTVSTGKTLTTNGAVLMFAFDLDAGKMWMGMNGSWWDSGAPSTGTNPIFSSMIADTYTPAVSVYGSSTGFDMNFGQRPFSYTPPTGFKTLNTYNLPDPTIKKPNQYMDATLYTGTGSDRSVTNAGGFQPDLVMLKCRSNVQDNPVFDSSRGVLKEIYTDLTNSESTETIGLSSFNSNGFSLTSNRWNNSGYTFVGWQWKESATSGFDIVTYTGNGANRTIAHTLGVAPKMMIVKRRDSSASWAVWHTSFVTAGNSDYLLLNTTDQKGYAGGSANAQNLWNSTVPTSSVFSLGTYGYTNQNAATYVAYLFAEIDGFSKFGSYTGNGSTTDGPFVFTNMKPRYVLIKRTDSATNWYIFDTARDTYNVMKDELLTNAANAEADNSRWIDCLSNGFKIRNDNVGQINASGGTYIYAAFAENPFKYSNAR